MAFIIALVFLVVILIIGWLGLRVKPKPFPAYPQQTPSLDSIDLPEDLPAPVTRYYQAIMGDRVPIIKSAILTGSATLRVFGLRFPSRFRITHHAGRDYRHYIEVTVFGRPIMRVNERYRDGRARMELPFGTVENEPKIDMAANLGLWAESIWLPSIFLTDPRVRWEVVDETTARLRVPFGEEEDTLTITFDPKTGLIRTMEAMRYRDAGDEAKILWRSEPLGWRRFHGIAIPSPASLTWMDQRIPWSIWTIDEVTYNVDVSEYIRARGL